MNLVSMCCFARMAMCLSMTCDQTYFVSILRFYTVVGYPKNVSCKLWTLVREMVKL
jgi:hypothetical protein